MALQTTLRLDEETRASNETARTLRARGYQQEIIAEAMQLLETEKSVLIEQATGTGKTFVACEIIRKLHRARVLWIVHRIELVDQAWEALTDVTGETVGRIVPGNYTGLNTRIAVASRDTIVYHLDQIGQYDLIIIDEAHHIPTYRYESILNAIPHKYRLGMTATVDRSDRRDVRKWFKAATKPYTIPVAINDSWLVPIEALRIKVQSVDLSKVRTVGRDFNAEELDAVMSAYSSIDGMAKAILKEQGERPTLVFCTSIDAAQSMNEALGWKSRLILGETDKYDRRSHILDFGKSYQTLVSVGTLTEGVDLPSASLIAICRPTKSRPLFTQMLGRGLRPEKGIDECELMGSLNTGRSTRQWWIEHSSKPNCLILDFVGAVGKHSIVTPADLLSDNAEAVRKVKKQIEQGDKLIDVMSALKREEGRIARENQKKEAAALEWAKRNGLILPDVKYDKESIGVVGLDGVLNLTPQEMPIQPTQAKRLFLMGVKPDASMSASEATKLIAETEAVRSERGLASIKQLETLSRYGLADPVLTKKKAIGYFMRLKSNGWKPWGIVKPKKE